MRKGKELIGKPIFSITDGRDQGSVKDLYLDLDLKLLKGIYLGREGLLSRKVRVIARENVAVFGIDAILTSDSDVISDNSQLPEVDVWLRRDDLQGREVETAGGTKVGTIGDVLFDEQAMVAGVSLARVHVAGPIAENKILLRSAITDTGGREGAMIVDLSLAEQPLPGAGQLPSTEQAAAEEPQPIAEQPEESAAEPAEDNTAEEAAEQSE